MFQSVNIIFSKLINSIGISAYVVSLILRGKRYLRLGGIYLIPCDMSLYQSLFLLIDGYWFEIPPETYVLEIEELGGCILGIIAN